MNTNELVSLLQNNTLNNILEKTVKEVLSHKNFIHITSINPENCILSLERRDFRKALQHSQIHINDGVGIVLAAQFLGLSTGPRIPGIDLMKILLQMANEKSLAVMLIGAGPKIAERVVECQQKTYPRIKFYALQGISDIKSPKKQEEAKIFSIVTEVKPSFVFVSFGSPWQELWLYNNRKYFKGCVCVGVGGAFDFLAGTIPRAPVFIRKIGLEWLYRLIRQPWRIKRQIRLIRFIWIILKLRFAQK